MRLQILLIFASVFIIASCSNPTQGSSESISIPTTATSSATPTQNLRESGDLIVFVGTQDESISIGLMDENGMNIRYITDTTGNDFLPKWSPDGQQIAYLSDRQTSSEEQEQLIYTLWLVELSTEQSTLLTHDNKAINYLTSFAWSPDNKALIYQTPPFDASIIKVTDLSSERLGENFRAPFAWASTDNIAIADIAIDPPRAVSLAVLAPDHAPLIPPEDGFLAGGHYPLHTSTSIDWHPQGEQLAIGSYRAGRGRGNLVVASVGEEDLVFEASLSEMFEFIRQGEVTDLSWSPDGTMIAFSFISLNDADREDDNIEQIYVTNNELTELSALTPRDILCNYPQWSPDSTKLVFACEGDGQENSDIWVVNKDGSGLQQLTNTPTYEGQPMWQPNP